MHSKLLIILSFFFLMAGLNAESKKSPHGDKLKTDCAVCHTTNGWNVIKPNGFNHNKTRFPLKGQHQQVNCKSCHTSLKFEEAKTDCNSCHKDVHEGTVGFDCARCHSTNSWIVSNIRQIHQQDGFVMLGAHATADCNRCHTSASKLRFENRRSDCYACHQSNFEATTSPNHKQLGFSTDCESCHSMSGRDWTAKGKGFDHGFFPLVGGHNIECTACHYDNYKENLSTKCDFCHSVSNSNPIPAHQTKFATYECNACHSVNGWTSGIKFRTHDSWGKIYSGKHRGKWSACTDCHTNDAAYEPRCNKCHRFSTGELP
jgi:hypothetical protein